MKVAILAGGKGTRLQEETELRPKPMVEIGGKPILWHIMRQYDHFGFRNFVIGLGYMGEHIKRYMVESCALSANLTVNLRTGSVLPHGAASPDWQVELIDTGQTTNTGGPHQASGALPGELDLPADLGRRRLEPRPLEAPGVPPQPRQARHSHRSASAGALRRPRARR